MKSMYQKGITLIALVLTIVILIILAGVGISTLIKDDGILKKATTAKEETQESTAEERLKLELANLAASKFTDNNYNQNEYVDNYLKDKGITVIDNAAFVDGWQFMINRDSLAITSNIGKGNFNDNIIVNTSKQSFLNSVKLTISIQSDTEIAMITLNNEQIQVPSPLNNVYTITKEITQKSSIKIIVKDNNQSFNISNIEDVEPLWCELLTKANIDSSEYENFSVSMTTENINKIAASSEAMNFLGTLFSNSQSFSVIANNRKLMDAVCENSSTRLAMYNNYTITEPILASSQVALASMQASSRYQLISKNIYNYFGSTTFVEMYNGKAFVFGLSQNRNADGGFWSELQTVLSVKGGIVKAKCSSTYATTGLKYRINKFASTVKLAPYGRDPAQSSIYDYIYGYVTIFKI